MSEPRTFGDVTLHVGDCLGVLREMPDASVDAVVTDPPAGISFMGKSWDGDRGGRAQWVAWFTEVMSEALRVTKPGGHAAVWALPRTSHWTATALEDAGWEIRDRIAHLFGTGFPKSLDVSRAIDRSAGALREVVGERNQRFGFTGEAGWNETSTPRNGTVPVTSPATDAAQLWDGWGTALKPAAEDWWLVRKPLAETTIAGNVVTHGTGALNIDGCRVTPGGEGDYAHPGNDNRRQTMSVYGTFEREGRQAPPHAGGRWPPNVVLTHAYDCEPVGTRTVRADGHHPAARPGGGISTSGHAGQDGLAERKSGEEVVETWRCAPGCPVAELDTQSGVGSSSLWPTGGRARGGLLNDTRERPRTGPTGYVDSGGASRFFPVFRWEAKAPTVERPRDGDVAHPTVKPLGLLTWMVRLVCPPGGTVLDPFAGSGTTGEACVVEGFRCILIEREEQYLSLIVARLTKPIAPVLW